MDIYISGKGACSFGIAPVEVDTGKFGSLPIFGDGVVQLKGFAQVVDMAPAGLFYTKTVKDEYKEDGPTFLALQARGGGGLVLPCCVEVSFEELIGEHARLG